MKSNSKIDKWLRWLKELDIGIYELLYSKYLYNEVRQIIQSNPKIQTDGYFYEWLSIAYSKSASINVRKMIDTRSDVISLGRLLTEIIYNPDVINFERFESYSTADYDGKNEVELMFLESRKKQARKEYEEFSGDCFPNIDPQIVRHDLDSLKSKCEPIKKYVDKLVAHRDKSIFRNIPTYNDLDNAIESIYVYYKKYTHLIRGIPYDIDIIPQWNWREIFTHPWIDNI